MPSPASSSINNQRRKVVVIDDDKSKQANNSSSSSEKGNQPSCVSEKKTSSFQKEGGDGREGNSQQKSQPITEKEGVSLIPQKVRINRTLFGNLRYLLSHQCILRHMGTMVFSKEHRSRSEMWRSMMGCENERSHKTSSRRTWKCNEHKHLVQSHYTFSSVVWHRHLIAFMTTLQRHEDHWYHLQWRKRHQFITSLRALLFHTLSFSAFP